MILITGGAGYIGSHVNKLLHQQGYETLVLDNLVYGHRSFVKWGEFIKGDLADTVLLERIFSSYPIDAVMHFAAYAYVGESVENPAKYYVNNVGNTLHLLETMRRHSVKDIVFSSTCATYGVPQCMPIIEEAVQQPINPYGRSKQMIELILNDYQKAYGLRYCVLRYFNAAGADPAGDIGEWHVPETHLIPLVLEAALGKRSEIVVFGGNYPTVDGTCVRDYIHVCDLADAHVKGLAYIRQKDCADCFNLGNGQGYSVKEIIAAAQDVTGKRIPYSIRTRRPGDPPALIGSAEKAQRLLNWSPRFGLQAILETAWNWRQKVEEHEVCL